MTKIQQHDGVVVDAAGSRQGFAKLCERERCYGREREAPGAGVRLPSLPPLYIGPLGRGAAKTHLGLGGGGQGVERGALPPKARGKLPPRVPNPRRMGGGPRGGAQPTRGWFPSTFSPWGPPG